METPTQPQPLTLQYKYIVERRETAIHIDLGEQKSVWFPLHRIQLNEKEHQLIGPEALIAEKLEEAKGAPIKYNAHDSEMIKLPEPAWADDKNIGVDVVISHLSGNNKQKKRIFFPKSQIKDGAAPRWLIKKKQDQLISEVAASQKKHSRDELMIKPFTETGLLNEPA